MTVALAWVGVAAVGALGAFARYQVDTAVSTRRPSDFPLGTLVVNLTGGSLLGVLAGASVGGNALLVLGTGFLGAYTTFSTWMFESERLAEDGEWRLMWLNLVAPTLLGLAGAGLGWLLGGAIA